jgi:hydroxymethylbilane synthase
VPSAQTAAGPLAQWPDGRPVRLATRGSPLARRQTDMVAHLLAQAVAGLRVEAVVVRTEGDRRPAEPLERIGGQGVFAKEVQQAVLEGRADVAVHSAKDLPPVTPAGLVLAAVPARGDPRDALVGSTLARLGPGARVATGSARRRAQLANLRPDLTFVPVRGNIETRIARLGEGADAVVVAAVALERLGIAPKALDVLSPLTMLPQVGQGALALECAEGDLAVRTLLHALDVDLAHRALDAERAMLAALGASCVLPVAGFAEPGPAGLTLRGMVASADGRVLIHAEQSGSDPERLGIDVARALWHDLGGSELLGAGPAPVR